MAPRRRQDEPAGQKSLEGDQLEEVGLGLDFETYMRLTMQSLLKQASETTILLKGEGKEPGLVDDVRELKRRDAGHARFEWLVFATLVVMAIGVLWKAATGAH